MFQIIKGQVISGEFGKIVIRQKSDQKLELGELLISETGENKILLQVFDLIYGSQISQQNLELISGMALEENAILTKELSLIKEENEKGKIDFEQLQCAHKLLHQQGMFFIAEVEAARRDLLSVRCEAAMAMCREVRWKAEAAALRQCVRGNVSTVHNEVRDLLLQVVDSSIGREQQQQV